MSNHEKRDRSRTSYIQCDFCKATFAPLYQQIRARASGSSVYCGSSCVGKARSAPVAMQGEKPCTGCGKVKLAGAYRSDATKPDGLSTRCKDCKSASDKRWRDNNIERVKDNMRRWYQEHPRNNATVERRGREQLSDGYVRHLLVNHLGVSRDMIPGDLVGAKRAQMLVYRETKERK